MKKLTVFMMTALLMCTFISTPLQANTGGDPVSTTTTMSAAKANTLTARLHEIKSLDKSNMSASEKRELRKETRSIKRELSGGIYISVGAAILIALLLILLL